MAVRDILTIGNPLLRIPARQLSLDEISHPATQTLIDDLIETMKFANGAGLAAPQVGWPVQVAAICVNDNPRYPYKPNIPLTVLINPKITVLSPFTEYINEGCLSVPKWRGEVPRFMTVRVDALDRLGTPLVVEAKGLTAATFQHEVDHLHGRLFVDRVADGTTFMTWDNFDRFHRDRFEFRAKRIVEKYGQ